MFILIKKKRSESDVKKRNKKIFYIYIYGTFQSFNLPPFELWYINTISI